MPDNIQHAVKVKVKPSTCIAPAWYTDHFKAHHFAVFAFSSTGAFLTLSFQLIFSILLKIQTSKFWSFKNLLIRFRFWTVCSFYLIWEENVQTCFSHWTDDLSTMRNIYCTQFQRFDSSGDFMLFFKMISTADMIGRLSC